MRQVCREQWQSLVCLVLILTGLEVRVNRLMVSRKESGELIMLGSLDASCNNLSMVANSCTIDYNRWDRGYPGRECGY